MAATTVLVTHVVRLEVAPPPVLGPDKVREIRIWAGLDVPELAALLDAAPRTVAGWEAAGRSAPPGPSALILSLIDKRNLGWVTYPDNHSRVRSRMDAARVREIRTRIGLSQQGLAAVLGVAHRLVVYWEDSGEARRPGSVPARLLRLAELNGLSHILLGEG